MDTNPLLTLPRLVDRLPGISGPEIVRNLVPPPQFAHATFESYQPDSAYPSQAATVKRLREFSKSQHKARVVGLFAKKIKTPESIPTGVYLDGGFGVGKTHLLAALWHEVPGRKYFGTFIEYTALVGALGYAAASEALTGASLICIDEFELDDPGDTMIMTRLLGALAASGTRIAATSNTPPNALGEGRFAAADFLREIQALASNFETIRIDGTDYRQRGLDGHAVATGEETYQAILGEETEKGLNVTDDSFPELMAHLAKIHPSSFVRLLDGVAVIGLRSVTATDDQTQALRLVAFIDRVYDAQIPIVATGVPLDQVFAGGMLNGGYRKKYLRAMSRMIALTSELA
ncbi:cell division protein ZapE [Klugiella xanthotipulae]|uniref:Cell division protein ZapE n=1 Tax=Klugiella xanthotipulae TaxID=244735 RepID=A0A543HS87_9MICO|nr:cell division protein ZapE [Klugiella xanthotipulae]TQM61185.1 cell division protein ZapE [Klugiella xanthotipulae]